MAPKFRAWDRKNKVMRDVKGLIWEETDLIGHCNLIAHCPPRGHEFNEWFTVALDGSKYQLMQSTGLKDKNGVEIFEGDIVVNQYGNVGYVAYLQQEAGFVVVKKKSDYRLGHRSTGESYDVTTNHEVIGNIHSNPELLDKSNEN